MKGREVPVLIDSGFLADQTAGDPELQDELLAMFIEQGETVAVALRSGAAEPLCLHRLKGAAHAIGAGPLALALERLEAEVAKGAGTGVPPDLTNTALNAIEATCSFAARLCARTG